MLTAVRRRLADEGGVTLVELLVVITLMSVVGGVMARGMIGGMQATAATQSRFEALAEVQKSVARMTRELRAAEPLVSTPAPNTAVVETYRADFVQRWRYTITYCPTQERIYMRREATTVPWSAVDCTLGNAPLLLDGVVNNPGEPFLRFQKPDTTTATQIKDVFRIIVTVRREVPGQTDSIVVRTAVRLRNARS